MSEEIGNRWAIVTKALQMALEREVAEGILLSMRTRMEDVYVEYMGETGEEPPRPDFSDEKFDELFGPEELKFKIPAIKRPDSVPRKPARHKRARASKRKSKKKKGVKKGKKKSAKKPTGFKLAVYAEVARSLVTHDSTGSGPHVFVNLDALVGVLSLDFHQSG